MLNVISSKNVQFYYEQLEKQILQFGHFSQGLSK